MKSDFHDKKPDKISKYVAKKPDKKGFIHYSDEEHCIWQELITRQMTILQERACDEFLHGLEILDMSTTHIPQPQIISEKLYAATGWTVAPVPALISYDRFFELLANRQFPAASFIRTREEMDYLQEPDIFHEYFGHCPLLTNPYFADFTQRYSQVAFQAGSAYHAKFARLYWFTVEFGLIKTTKGLRCYGGGILSSKQETLYAMDSSLHECKPLDFLEALRTPYRIDILQPIYFVINSFKDLYDALDVDLISLIHTARELGEYPAKFIKE